MKIAITADLHLKQWNKDISPETGISRRLTDTLNVFESICNYSLENRIEQIDILGDIGDLKNVVHVNAFNPFKKLLIKYDKLRFVLLHGNHDAPRFSDHSAISLFNGIPNVITIEKPTIINDITYIPYSDGNLGEIIKDLPFGKFMFGHFGLSDAILANGLSIRTEIETKNIKNKWKISVLGHYHVNQCIDNVYYVGSPIQLDRGEQGQEKRFLVLDTEKETIESIPTEGYKKYYRFEINEENKEEIFEKASELKNSGHHVDIIKYDDINLDIFKEKFLIIDKQEKDISNRGINSSMSMSDKLKRYMDIKKINEEDFIKYEEIAMDIINSSKGESR